MAALRGLLRAAGWAPRTGQRGAALEIAGADPGGLDLLCVRNLRRLLEELHAHKKALVRYGAHALADVVALLRHLPLAPAAYKELLPGAHALVAMCTDVELQELHAASDAVERRVLKELLEGERSQKRAW